MPPISTQLPRFASALSLEADARRAEEQALEALRTGLAGKTPDLLCIFVSHHHGGTIDGLGPRIGAATGARVIVGCTGESIIGGAREIEQEPALSLWAAVLPGTEIRPFEVSADLGPDERPEFSSWPEIRENARASILLFGDPYSFPMDEYLKELNQRYPGVPVVGGMASGGMGPGQNLLLTGSGLLSGGALGLVLEGDIEVRSVVSQGCRPVGKPWVVTACHEHMLQKLGGRPAVDVLVETLQTLDPADQKLFQGQPFVGLAIDAAKSTFERGDFLVRGIMGFQPKDKSIAVADMPRRGMTVQFLVRDARSASEDLELLLESRAGEGSPLEPGAAGALLFSCNGRGSRMFGEPDHDAKRVRAGLKSSVPLAGFFAMGEIGPVGGRNFLHGYTASLAVFRPRAHD